MSKYYLIGSWIPTIKEMDFEKLTKEFMGKILSESFKGAEFIFHQLDCKKIDKIEIRKTSSKTLLGEIIDVQVNNDGYWQGKLELHRSTERDPEWLDFLLFEIGAKIKEYYHEHLFHSDNNFRPISVHVEEIQKGDYNNPTYKLTAFKDRVLINVAEQYIRKFENYQTVLTQKFKNHIEIVNDLIIQIRGEILFYESFIALFIHIKEKIEDADICNILITKYVEIYHNKFDFYTSQKVIGKSNKLAGISIVLGAVGIILTVIGLIFG